MALKEIIKDSSGVPTGEYSLVAGGTLYADMPVASEVKFDGVDIPSSFLACDGSTFSSTTYPELAEALGGTTLPTNNGYIIKAKSEAIPTSFLNAVDEAVEDVYGDIIPNDASASNKLVAHQTPYDSFTLNNNSSSQKWYKLGTYMSGNNTARLDFVSARVDGQMFESSVRISGNGTNSNYVSWIGEEGCEISTIDIKVDTNRNLYVKMNSYSAVEIRVYGVFTLDIVEQSSEPSGTQIVIEKLVTESDIATVIYSSMTSSTTFESGVSASDIYGRRTGNVMQLNFNTLSITTAKSAHNLLCTLPSTCPTASVTAFFTATDVNTGNNYMLYITNSREIHTRTAIPANTDLAATSIYCIA